MMRQALIGMSALVLALTAAPAASAADDYPYRPQSDWFGSGKPARRAYGPQSLGQAPAVRLKWKPVLVLMDFSDKNGKGSAAYFQDMLFSRHPADEAARATFPYKNVTMADLYASMSDEGLLFDEPIVVDWGLAAKPFTYYTMYPGLGCHGLGKPPYDGSQEKGAIMLVREALTRAENAGVDLEALDKLDGGDDDAVSGVFVVHAGPGAEQTSGDFKCEQGTTGGDLWSHQFHADFASKNGNTYSVDYLIGPAESVDPRSKNGLSAMGVWAHEFGHMLALPDLYTTSEANGYGVGCWDLMGYGIRSCSTEFNGDDPGEDPNEMSVFTRRMLDWSAPRAVTENVCNRDVAPVQYGGETFKVTPDQQKPSDYFLVEYRGAVGRDQDLLSFSSDENTNRVCVWHIDEGQAWDMNPNVSSCDPLGDRLQCKSNHYGVMLVEYDGNYSLPKGAAYIEAGDCMPQGQMLSMADRKDLKTWSSTGETWSVAAGVLRERGRISITVDPNTPAIKPEITGSPGDAVRGDLWAYRPRVKTPSGMPQWRLVTYPKGMTIDADTGKIAWRVPAGFTANKVKVTLAVSNCGGEDEQAFTLAVIEPEAGCGCRTAGGPSVMDVLPFVGMFVMLRLVRRLQPASRRGRRSDGRNGPPASAGANVSRRGRRSDGRRSDGRRSDGRRSDGHNGPPASAGTR